MPQLQRSSPASEVVLSAMWLVYKVGGGMICRGCNGDDLAPVVPGIVRCTTYECGLVQSMADSGPRPESACITGLCADVERRVKLFSEDVVIDTMSHDGALLRSYSVRGLVTIGFEAEKNDGISCPIPSPFHVAYSGENIAYLDGTSVVPKIIRKAKVITSTDFGDVNDPNKFIVDAKKALRPDGIWCLQTGYLPKMFDMMNGSPCYYHLRPLKLVLERSGVEVNEVRVIGNEIRVFTSFAGSRPVDSSVRDTLEQEKKMLLHTPIPYEKIRLNRAQHIGNNNRGA